MLKREIIYEPKDLADLAKTRAAYHSIRGKAIAILSSIRVTEIVKQKRFLLIRKKRVPLSINELRECYWR